MSESFVQCDVCDEMIPKDKAIFDKGVNYPEIAKSKHEEDDVIVCYSCNEKLKQAEVPNPDD